MGTNARLFWIHNVGGGGESAVIEKLVNNCVKFDGSSLNSTSTINYFVKFGYAMFQNEDKPWYV